MSNTLNLESTDSVSIQAQADSIGKQEASASFDNIIIKPKKKKKKSKKSRSKRGLGKPTGFEEYYVDVPMTPAEFETEQVLYNPSRPIFHRIEDALQRYQKNRRLENFRRDIFLKYLAYGGVDISPRMFAGADQKDLKDLDSEQILQARTQTSIPRDTANLTIDFDEVVRGYLTSYFPSYFNPETEDMVKLGTVTIRNFLSYLLYHEVCPEYKDNIDQARKSCDIAATELWKNQQFMVKGPGHFNKACSTLFGGHLYDYYTEEDDEERSWADGPPMTRDVARKVVRFALAGAGSDQLAIDFRELGHKDELRSKRVNDIHGFEIMVIHPPGDTVLDFYRTHAPDLVPVGRVTAISYWDPAKPACDMTPEQRQQATTPVIFSFFVEQPLLQLCYPGMKVITPVWRMNCGLDYFEETFTVYGTIYTVLANDLMLGWKKPRPVYDTADGDEMEADEDDASEQGDGIADVQDVL
ncbi:hypothetical protein BO82DRAFT_372973 [Aspergillus uvarum CBS 121591]|uniref:Argonaute complex, subunit Arb1 n=1 Tax=Aspergillus uvarum CBS 121591 TaxID=1448315 RepID=A0A319CDT3_9EURO|nr:hypothetical protein BO82DRAFT_372973 [Aspergillus uvarum CBS 121591]PYH83835.1 hypothetical protein BO82DRAFT_372973 [Aspergillus uvarum CBS 121591]